MSLCRLMVMDFMESTGRFREDMGPDPLYGEKDLKFGIMYAEDLISSRYKWEPFYRFNLVKFKSWCEEKLRELE